jgi:type IV secretion system protein VirB10
MSAQPCRWRCHPAPPGSASAKGGGWGNIALLGAGAALIGAMGGIAIGYAPSTIRPAKAAEQPAKASDRAVADVMASPNAQRAALAGQLGQPNAPRPTSSAGRRATPGQQPTDVNGNPFPTNGQQTPAQTRAQQARAMADAARRSPIMAFGSPGLPQALPSEPDSQARSSRANQRSPQNFGASGSGRPAPMRTASWQQARAPPISATSSGTPPSRLCAPASSRSQFLLSAGTVIPCTLQTAINSTQAGLSPAS